MNKLIVEFLGTYFLVLTVGLAGGLGHAGDLTPLAVGAVLIAVIYAGGHISGAHYNPAVTLAFWLQGRGSAREFVGYLGFQLLGAALAAVTVRYLAGGVGVSLGSGQSGPTFVAELVFTLALCWVILQVATAQGISGNEFYGLAIASIVVAGAYAVGPISGALFNPAVTVGVCLIGQTSCGSIGIYLSAQFLAAILAFFLFKQSIRT